MGELTSVQERNFHFLAVCENERLEKEIPQAQLALGLISRRRVVRLIIEGIKTVVKAERSDFWLDSLPQEEGGRAHEYASTLNALGQLLLKLKEELREEERHAVAAELREWSKHTKILRLSLQRLVGELLHPDLS